MRKIKEPKNLSPRIQALRDFYFCGVERGWNNEWRAFTTGTAWDKNYNEMTWFVAPETYTFFKTFSQSCLLSAKKIPLPDDFFTRSIAERRAWFIKKAMVDYVPQEVLPGDLLCGAVFNITASHCLTRQEQTRKDHLMNGKKGLIARTIEFHDRGYGNCGATSGHIIPGYERALTGGFRAIHADLEARYQALPAREQARPKGAQLRAMLEASLMPKEVAAKYAALCEHLAGAETDPVRRKELERMAANCRVVPWEPPCGFWQAVQSLWFIHMLVMSDENYPGPGLSFGRVDQYLYPYFKASLDAGEDREFLKEILKCLWVHCNTAYDAMIKVGMNQGITAGYGQLMMISGLGKNGADMTNDLSYALLEVIDDLSPLLEPKPNVRLHRGTPEPLLDKVSAMIAESQGAPFLLNFDERSMAGLLREARDAGVEHLINPDNVYDYASVGCLENTMVGNDRSSTVDVNINFLKALELTFGNGRDIVRYNDALWGKPYKNLQMGPKTGDPKTFKTFDDFYAAFLKQIQFCIKKIVSLYSEGDAIRAAFLPTPYLSCLVKGCAESGRDVTQGGAELKFATLEGVTFATTIDSLLAVKYLVYDTKTCTMDELITALKDNWAGHEVLQARAKNKAPKYGRDDAEADTLAQRFMAFWSTEAAKYKTPSGQVFRGGMLSWNYWVSDGFILAASPDGRKRGQFLSNAICPSNGADIHGPTANSNSVGYALGGRDVAGNYVNFLPNGASHTITMSPALMRDDEHRSKFKAFLRGYIENGGTALQVNVLDPETLRDAQKNPDEYRHLLVRVTGYNAYFTSIGRELQNEIIERESHGGF
ncbi:MAG: hypothetical protein LBR16_05695 [Treponema sp.]|jgi:formate C-acetyltransferase|nr:hypothetical protein [Treponema sp.]